MLSKWPHYKTGVNLWNIEKKNKKLAFKFQIANIFGEADGVSV